MLVWPFLLIFLVITFDFLRLSYTALSQQYISANVMREIEIRRVSASSVRTEIQDRAKWAMAQIPPADSISLCLVENYPQSCTGIAAPNPGDLMVLAVHQPIESYALWLLELLTDRTLTLKTKALGRIEPE